MIEFATQHTGFAALAAFFLYAIAIYKVVDVVKKMTVHVEKLQPWRVAMAAILGLATGPFIYPWIFHISGVESPVPLSASMIMGIGTGGVAVNIYNYIQERLERKQEKV